MNRDEEITQKILSNYFDHVTDEQLHEDVAKVEWLQDLEELGDEVNFIFTVPNPGFVLPIKNTSVTEKIYSTPVWTDIVFSGQKLFGQDIRVVQKGAIYEKQDFVKGLELAA